MSEFILSGRIVDLILVLIVVEAAALWLFGRLTSKGPPFAELLGNLAAGACLVMALRMALTDAHWHWLALWLLLALVAHVADLAYRWFSSTQKSA